MASLSIPSEKLKVSKAFRKAQEILEQQGFVHGDSAFTIGLVKTTRTFYLWGSIVVKAILMMSM